MMKKRVCGMALAVAGVAASMWLASPAFAAESWTRYENGRFGYSVEYPDIFRDAKKPDNGDGVQLESDDEEHGLIISGGYNALEQDAEQRLASRLEEVSHIVEGSIDSGDGWYRVVYSDDGGMDGVEHLFHEYGIINKDAWATFILGYPKAEEKRFAEIKERMEASLKLPEGETKEKSADISVFSLKGGKVYKNKTALDCEVREITGETEGPIRFWSVFGPDTSDAVTENETGVWFFSGEGVCLTFVPLESEYEAQDVAMSPDGGAFVLVTGSGIRPDIFFNVYGEGTEKTAELSGVRGQLVWLDPVRFAFTRIDDARDIEGGIAAGNWLKTSLVMYDTAAKEETILKEATDKLNYSYPSLSDGGNSLTVTEESVKSEKDWEDDDKVTRREIRVEIPAAG
jgi:hypothetical protein